MTRKAKGKGFYLRSGNSPLEFKQMGSSPANLNNFGIGKGVSPYTAKEDDDEERKKKAEELKKKGEDYIDKMKGKDSSGDVIAEAGKGAKESGDKKSDKKPPPQPEPEPEPEVKAKSDIGRKIKNTLIAGITGGLDAVYGTGKVVAAGDSVKFYESDKHKDDTEEKTEAQKIIENQGRSAGSAMGDTAKDKKKGS